MTLLVNLYRTNSRLARVSLAQGAEAAAVFSAAEKQHSAPNVPWDTAVIDTHRIQSHQFGDGPFSAGQFEDGPIPARQFRSHVQGAHPPGAVPAEQPLIID